MDKITEMAPIERVQYAMDVAKQVYEVEPILAPSGSYIVPSLVGLRLFLRLLDNCGFIPTLRDRFSCTDLV